MSESISWGTVRALFGKQPRQAVSVLLPHGILGFVSNLPRPLRKLLRFGYRRRIARSYFEQQLRDINSWAWRETESTNFNYSLEPLNREYLGQLLARVFNVPLDMVLSYFAEIEEDATLTAHLAGVPIMNNFHSQIAPGLGRRIGWYAIVRILKPGLVVETGVDEGLGACVLASAILKNRREGYPGSYLGTEIRESAGRFFSGPYAEVGKILWGDSLASLRSLEGEIGLFVNDSDHSESYEYDEYQAISNKLAGGAVILGDNCEGSGSLSRYSRETQRDFVFFAERPADHWFPGAGIGISIESARI